LLSVLAIISLFDHYLWTSYFGLVLWWVTIGIGVKYLYFSEKNTFLL